MKVALTSFGTGVFDDAQVAESDPMGIFFHMPPVSMVHLAQNSFMPDYAALLLCDKIIMDGSAFDDLMHRHMRIYDLVADTLHSLYIEGFIELRDFGQILRVNEALLESATQKDIAALQDWLPTMSESTALWRSFLRRLRSAMLLNMEGTGSLEKRDKAEEFHMLSNLAATRAMKQEYAIWHEGSQALGDYLVSYLQYVNANLLISGQLGVGFYDWRDFGPFYRRKFSSATDSELPGYRETDDVQGLFEVAFPEYAITDTRTFMKIVTDERIVSLRRLVQDAVDGKIVFDQEFARRTFKEILGIERRGNRYRNIVSYLTMPCDLLNLFPGMGAIIGKAIEHVTGNVIDNRLRDGYQWFYLLDDLVLDDRKE